jgi:hypothetical protein
MKKTGELNNGIVAGLYYYYLEATRRTNEKEKNTLIINPFQLLDKGKKSICLFSWITKLIISLLVNNISVHTALIRDFTWNITLLM